MNNKGYTLIDLLIGLAILLIAIPIFYNIFLLIHKMNDFSYSQTINIQDSRFILNFITSEIGDAKSVNILTNQLQYTDKDGNSKIISHDNLEKAVKIYKDGTLISTLGQDNISSLTFQDATPAGTNKKGVRVTIEFVNGDDISTMVMTMNDMS